MINEASARSWVNWQLANVRESGGLRKSLRDALEIFYLLCISLTRRKKYNVSCCNI